MTDEELFSRAFPLPASKDGSAEERGISKLGWYAAQIHAAFIAKYGTGADADSSVAQAEALMIALEKRQKLSSKIG